MTIQSYATTLTVLIALPIAVATVAMGCAASPDTSGPATGEAFTSGASPITLANYVSHPTITAIRRQVQAIAGMALEKQTHSGCDGSNDKFTDSHGRIRKVVETGGEGGLDGETSVYYDERGKPIFEFHIDADWTGGKTNGATDVASVAEWRVYFTADSGATIFEAIREGIAKDPHVGLTTADRLPTDSEKVADASAFSDPAAWYASTGCGVDVPHGRSTIDDACFVGYSHGAGDCNTRVGNDDAAYAKCLAPIKDELAACCANGGSPDCANP